MVSLDRACASLGWSCWNFLTKLMIVFTNRVSDCASLSSLVWSPWREYVQAEDGLLSLSRCIVQVKHGFLVRMVFLDLGCAGLVSRMCKLSTASLDPACDCASRVWRMCKPRVVLLASGRMPQPMRGSPPTTLPPPLITNTSTDHNQGLGKSHTLKHF